MAKLVEFVNNSAATGERIVEVAAERIVEVGRYTVVVGSTLAVAFGVGPCTAIEAA